MKSPEPYLVWKEPEPAAGPDAPKVLDRAGLIRWLRYGALLTVVLIALPPLPYLVSALWLTSLATGYGAAALIAILMLLPLRRLAGWPNTRISVERHKRLGEWALGLSAIHTVLLLAGDSVSLEYLWPSQPRFMLAGNMGLVLLALLVVTSLERIRVGLFGNQVRYRPVHVASSVLLVVLTAAHTVGSGIFVAHAWKAALVALISGAVIAAVLRRPREKDQPEAGAGSEREQSA
jgi:hypothetical protein